MKLLSDYIDKSLVLKKHAFFGFDYDLLAEGEVIGSLEFTNTFSFLGMASFPGNKRVEFYKEKFWTFETCVREIGKQNPFARHKREVGFYIGLVELAKGNRLRIKYGFFFMNTEIEDEKGNVVAVLKRSNFFSWNIKVIINNKSNLLDENPWIIFLALYIITKGMMRRA